VGWLNPFFLEYPQFHDKTVTRGWANVGEERRLENYWFVNQGPGVAPMMSRYVTQFFYLLGTINALYVEFNTSGTGAGIYAADSGLNILGQRLTLEVRDWTTVHPIRNSLGVAFKFVYSRVGFLDDVTNELFFAVPQPGDPECPFNLDNPEGLATIERPNEWTTTFEPGQDTDWTSPNPSGVCQFVAVSSGREIPKN